MNSKEIKLVFYDRLIPQGFRCFPTKRLYFKDCKFYLIVVEIQPYYGDGFFVNVGVYFHWESFGGILYSYSDGDNRLQGPDAMGSILFDSPKLTENLERMFEQVEALVEKYEKLQDLHVLLEKLTCRNDFKVLANKGFREHDYDLGITKILLNDQSGRELLEKDPYPSSSIQKILDCGFDKSLLDEQLLKIINEDREIISKRARRKLPLFSSIDEIINGSPRVE